MIDVTKITPYQKLIIERGLVDYRFVMKHWKQNDVDFQRAYYDFYLSARWAIMSKDGNRIPYFDKLQSIDPMDSLIDILVDLKQSMEAHSYEFSLGSKLLHTRNPLSPIYDSKVKEYLSSEENVAFWWHNTGAPRGTIELEKIRHDWVELNRWYATMLESERGQEWIDWFDDNFPDDTTISNVKKIDFIIFAVG